jgi:hypothetical protein
MTNATIDQIAEAANKPLADVPELEGIKQAIGKLDIAAAIAATRADGPRLRVSPGQAVANRLAAQNRGYGILDCIDIVDAIVYESFGEI